MEDSLMVGVNFYRKEVYMLDRNDYHSSDSPSKLDFSDNNELIFDLSDPISQPSPLNTTEIKHADQSFPLQHKVNFGDANLQQPSLDFAEEIPQQPPLDFAEETPLSRQAYQMAQQRKMAMQKLENVKKENSQSVPKKVSEKIKKQGSAQEIKKSFDPEKIKKKVLKKSKGEIKGKDKQKVIEKIKIKKEVLGKEQDKDKKIKKKEKNADSVKQFKKKYKSKIKKEKKEYERHVSIFPFLTAIPILILGIFLFYKMDQYQKEKNFEDLKEFVIPSDPTNFNPKSNAVILGFIQEGTSCLSTIQKKYPTMNDNQKVASFITMYEVRSASQIPFLLEHLKIENKTIIPFIIEALGRLGIDAVFNIIQAYNQAMEYSFQQRLLQALALANKYTPQIKENEYIIEKSIDTLINASKHKDSDMVTFVIDMFQHYHATKKIVGLLWDKSKDIVDNIAKTAQKILSQYQKSKELNEYAAEYTEKLLEEMKDAKNDVEKRIRCLQLMAIWGHCTRPEGGNYISLFLDIVRDSFKSNHVQEKATATYVLGKFRDDALKNEMIANLDQENAELSHNIGVALGEMFDSQIPEIILEKQFSNQPHVQKALADILAKYHIYIINLEWEEKSKNFLLNMIQNAKLPEIYYTTKTLQLYTSSYLYSLLLREQDIVDVLAEEKETLLEKYNKALYIKQSTELDKDLYEKLTLAQQVQENRFQLEKKYKNIQKQKFFILQDFKNFPSLMEKIRLSPDWKEGDKDKRSYVSKHVWTYFNPTLQKQLLDQKDLQQIPIEIQYDVLDAWNIMILDNNFYVRDYFEHLSDIQKPDFIDLQTKLQFHRMLLEKSYPEELQSIDNRIY